MPGIPQLEYDAVLRWMLAGLAAAVLLAVVPLTPDPAIDPKLLVQQVGAFAGLAVLLAGAWRRREPLRLPPILFALLAAFTTLAVLSSLFSENVPYTLNHAARYAALLALFAASAHAFRAPGQAFNAGLAVCVGMALCSVYGFAQRLGLDPFPWAEPGDALRRAPSTFGNPNFASHALLVTTVVATGAAAYRRAPWPLLFSLLFLAHFALTRTRGALLGLAAAALLAGCAALLARRNTPPVRGVALTLAVLAAAGGAAGAGVMARAAVETGSVVPFDRTLVLRYHSFYGASRMVQDRPWLGRGPGGYLLDNPAYWTELERDRFAAVRKMNAHVHNEPLEFGVDSGVFAATAWLAFLITGLSAGLYAWFAEGDRGRRVAGLTGAALFAGFSVDGLFGFNFHVPASSVLFVVFAGALLPRGAGKARPLPKGRPLSAGAWRAALLVVAAALPLLAAREYAAAVASQRGIAAAHFGEHMQAGAHFARAQNLAPGDWVAASRAGRSAYASGHYEAARACYRHALECNPHSLTALVNLTRTCVQLATAADDTAHAEARLAEALARGRRALELAPELPEANHALAQVLYLRARGAERAGASPGDQRIFWEEAGVRIARAAVLAPEESGSLYRMLGDAFMVLGDPPSAEQAYAKAVGAAPEADAVWDAFAGAAHGTGRYRAYLDCLDWTLFRARTGRIDERVAVDLAPRKAAALAAAGRSGVAEGPGAG